MARAPDPIPAFGLYGETRTFPDIMHCERLTDRAPGHGWRIAPHRHADLHQFLYIAGPRAKARIDDAQFAIDAPSLLSVPRWHVHAFRFARGMQGYVLSIPPGTLPDLLGPEAEVAGDLGVWHLVPAAPEIVDIFAAIRAELADTRPLRGPLLRAKATEIGAHILRASPRRGRPGGESPELRHMRTFEALVRANMRRHWTVADYARAIGLTPTHLSRISRRLTGLPASRFIEARLFQEARRLLAYTRNPVAQVGYELGFHDPAYFSRAFRRHEGTSPIAYRASHDPDNRAGRSA